MIVGYSTSNHCEMKVGPLDAPEFPTRPIIFAALHVLSRFQAIGNRAKLKMSVDRLLRSVLDEKYIPAGPTFGKFC